MSVNDKPRRLDRATAEKLLRGTSDAGASQPRLAALLAAASAPPGRAGHLLGEAAALAAFRAAHRDPAPQPRRLSMLRTTFAKLLTVKIGLACAAALSVGGVAVAATSGHLPGPLHLGAASSSAKPSHHPRPSGEPTAWPTAWPSHSLPPGIAALCRKYADQDRDHRGHALDDPKFKDLVDHAGLKDRDRVDHFCDFVLHGRPAPSGTPGAHPTDLPKPTGLPTTHPKPTLPPTAPPSKRGH